MIMRLGLASLAGVVITLALFYLMQALIQGAGSALTEDPIGNLVDFVRVNQDPDLQTRKRVPERPPEPETPPPDTPPQNFEINVDPEGFTPLGPTVSIDPGSFKAEGEYLPIVKVQPQYPRRALSRGMSGWVIVEFTVTAQGTVRDPFVLENCGWVQRGRNEGECLDSPNSVFDSSAKKAALKFKYKPKVLDGTPVATTGVRNKITFELEEG